jgi:hypothetical protein
MMREPSDATSKVLIDAGFESLAIMRVVVQTRRIAPVAA